MRWWRQRKAVVPDSMAAGRVGPGHTEKRDNMSNIPLAARNADLQSLVTILQTQREARLDAVVPAQAIRSERGVLQVAGLGAEGVENVGVGSFRPTDIMDGHLAEKLGIPLRYLRNLRENRVDLFDANVNGWLQGNGQAGDETYVGPDGRKFYLRTFKPASMFDEGIARALMSDQYKAMDNLDVTLSALGAIRDSGIETHVVRTNLTERGMNVRVAAPGIATLAPVLLENYRSPNSGWTLDAARAAARREGSAYEPGKEPVVFAGFDIGNSETGGGATILTPVLTLEICGNGLKFTMNALRHVHLGSKLAEGQVRWSAETQQRNLALVESQARDAVSTFLDREYITELLRPVEEKASVVLENPAKVIEVVAKEQRFSEETAAGILSHFVRGGQGTAGGVLNAVTSYAQEVEDADLADELESGALRCLEVAASV